MSHNQTMSDKKQMQQETTSSWIEEYLLSKSYRDYEKQQQHAALLAKHQQPHKFPASGSAGASAQ